MIPNCPSETWHFHLQAKFHVLILDHCPFHGLFTVNPCNLPFSHLPSDIPSPIITFSSSIGSCLSRTINRLNLLHTLKKTKNLPLNLIIPWSLLIFIFSTKLLQQVEYTVYFWSLLELLLPEVCPLVLPESPLTCQLSNANSLLGAYMTSSFCSIWYCKLCSLLFCFRNTCSPGVSSLSSLHLSLFSLIPDL